TPQACRDMLFQRLDDSLMHRLELRYHASLPREEFERSLRLHTDAAIAELNEYPPQRSVSRSQAKLADAVFEDVLAERWQTHFDAERAARVILNAEQASAE